MDWESLDLAVLLAINQTLTHPVLDRFFVWLTDPPGREIYFIVAGLALILFGGKKGRIAALTLGIAVALSDQISAGYLKPLFDRVRPCFAHADEVRLVLEKQARSGSFPSSHAANAFAVATVLRDFKPRFGPYLFVLAFLIAYSRPYVGVHYPSDSLFGAVLGVVLGLLVIWSRNRLVSLWGRRSKKVDSAQAPPELEDSQERGAVE